MADEARPHGHGQRAIDLQDTHDLRFWALKLHVSVEDIEAAVLRVGPAAADVQQFILRRRTATTRQP